MGRLIDGIWHTDFIQTNQSVCPPVEHFLNDSLAM